MGQECYMYTRVYGRSTALIQTISLTGKGLYTIPEAARIVHADRRSVRRWLLGYKLSEKRPFSLPVLPGEVLNLDGEQIVLFRNSSNCCS